VVIICQRLFYFGAAAVTDRLNRIPGVVAKQVWGSGDLPPTWYYAKADLEKGPRIFLFRLTRQSFSAGPFCFFQVGDHAVRYATKRGSINNSLCFDHSGAVSGLGNLFPRKIHRVEEFIEHVSAVEGVVAQWPRCPGSTELHGTDGRYWVCTNPDVSTDLWPDVRK
jgi:hypothetical protein